MTGDALQWFGIAVGVFLFIIGLFLAVKVWRNRQTSGSTVAVRAFKLETMSTFPVATAEMRSAGDSPRSACR